jgi:hypothetical protein
MLIESNFASVEEVNGAYLSMEQSNTFSEQHKQINLCKLSNNTQVYRINHNCEPFSKTNMWAPNFFAV